MRWLAIGVMPSNVGGAGLPSMDDSAPLQGRPRGRPVCGPPTRLVRIEGLHLGGGEIDRVRA